MQDIEIGDAGVRRGLHHQGRPTSRRCGRSCRESEIRELIAGQHDIHFSVKDDEGWFGAQFPEGVDELRFEVTGVIKDIERLKLLYELFAETLDQLCRIGSAYEESPKVEL